MRYNGSEWVREEEREAMHRAFADAPNRAPLPVEDAQAVILESLAPLEVEQVPLADCDGRVLAQEVVADGDVPPFDRSMMDGFAVRAADTAGASWDRPVPLTVIEEVPAGCAPKRRVGPGEAIRVMTGSMIPEGADAVVRFEHTKEGFAQNVATVHVRVPAAPGDNIARKGEDIARGSCVLRPGVRIGAAEAAVLATFGVAEVAVYRRPVVGILATGSELVDVNQPLAPGKIRNSNSYMVASLIRAAGGVPRLLAAVGDSVEAMQAAVEPYLEELDALVTTGGVSVGDYDLIPELYERLGAITRFWKVLARPGQPVRYAVRDGKPFFGISGNPASAYVNCQLFVLPGVRRLAGWAHPLPRTVQARLVSPYNAAPIKPDRFLRARLHEAGGELVVELAKGQSSGMIGSLVGANALVRIKGGTAVEAGQLVDVVVCGDWPPVSREKLTTS